MSFRLLIFLIARRMRGAKWLDCPLRHSQNLIDRRKPLHHLGKAIFAQSYQTPLAAKLAELGDVRISRHHVAQAVVHNQQLVDSQSSGISGLSASVASLAAISL